MALLFKRKDRIRKFQAGGGVPVYANYQYTPMRVSEIDPTALLAKYKGNAAGEKKEKKTPIKLPDIPGAGLASDNVKNGLIINQLRGRLQELYFNNLEDEPLYADIENKLNYLGSTQLEENKVLKEDFNAAFTNVSNNQGLNNLMFDGKHYLVKKIEVGEDGFEHNIYRKVRPDEVMSYMGDNWEFMQNGNAADDRKNNSELANDPTVTQFLHNGTTHGLTQAKEKFLNDYFGDLGDAADKTSTKIGGFFDANAGEVVSSILRGGSEISNTSQLNAAINAAVQYSKEGALYNLLASKAHMTPLVHIEDGKYVHTLDENGQSRNLQTPEEVEQYVKEYITKVTASRFKIATSKEDQEMYDFKNTMQLKMGGEESFGPTTEVSDVIAEVSGLDFQDIMIQGQTVNRGKVNTLKVKGLDAPTITSKFLEVQPDKTKAIKGTLYYYGQTLGRMIDVSNAILYDGTRISNLKPNYNVVTTEIVPGAQGLVVVPGQKMKVLWLPLDKNGVPLNESKVTSNPKYVKELKALHANKKISGAEVLAQEQMLLDKYMGQSSYTLTRGVNIKVDFNAGANARSKNNNETYIKSGLTLGEGGDEEGFTELLGDKLTILDADVIKRTNVFVPLTNNSELQAMDKDHKVPTSNATLKQFNANSGVKTAISFLTGNTIR